MNKKYLRVYLIAAVMFLFSSASVEAAELNVPQNYASISLAIKAANDGDVIMVSPGTYRENLNVRKNIEIRAVSNPGDTKIDGGGAGSVVSFIGVKFDGVRAPALSGFTITGGKVGSGAGGGVTIFGSDAVIENNTIQFNSSSFDAGGILVFNNSNATIRNNFIDSNSAGRYGAGLYVVTNSNPLIYNNHISNNNASGPSDGNSGAGGGGVYVDDNSSPQIIKNTITSNHADHAGGGISLRVNSNAIIEDNIITNNNTAYGGGIHLETEGGSPTIKNNTISNNSANQSSSFPGSGFGGGISIYNTSYPLIIDNEISNNFATQGGGGIVNAENAGSTITSNRIFSNKTTITSGSFAGGGIHVVNSSATINNNYIYANEARMGGGVGLLDNANANIQNNTIVKNKAPLTGGGVLVIAKASAAIIKNNIITQNEDYQIYEEHKKSVIRNNLMKNDGKGLYFNIDTGGIADANTLNNNSAVDSDGIVSGEESFIDSAGNNYGLQSNSVAINRGDGDIISPYDISYNLRPFNGAVDIGASEYTTVVQKTSPMYRFWSDTNRKHFYTIEKNERDTIFNTYRVGTWKYEGIAFRAFKLSDCVGKSQVYRFWSNNHQGHFYTISESEKNQISTSYPTDEWNLEGPAFCAEQGFSGSNAPLYRFWSALYGSHFYTANEGERNSVRDNNPASTWNFEGTAYYVYP